MDSGPNDRISMSESRNSPPAASGDCQVQRDDALQNKLYSLRTTPTNAVDFSSDGMSQCLPVPASNSARSEFITGTEMACDTLQGEDPGQSTTFGNELEVIISDDADTSIELPVDGILQETVLPAPTSYHPKPVHSSATGHYSGQCEQLTQGGDTTPRSPVSLQPNSEHMLAAATSPGRNEFTLAEDLSDAQDHTCRNGNYVEYRSCPVGSRRSGRTSRKRKPTPESP